MNAASQYHQGVLRKEHDYGEYIERIDFIKKAEEQLKNAGRENLVQKLAEMFLEEYPDELPNKNSRSAAFSKAKSLVRRKQNGYRKLLPRFNDKKGYRKAIREAIEKGYITNIRLDVPWHPKIFFDENKLTTMPFQHKYCVLYSGRGRHNFYDREFKSRNLEKIAPSVDKVDDLFNPESVLSKGCIEAGCKIDPGDEKNGYEKHWGIYFTSNLSKAAMYGNSLNGEKVVLECEIPSSFLIMSQGENSIFRNLKDLLNRFGSPRKFLESEKRSEGRTEYVVARKTEISNDQKVIFPLSYVNGVWDTEFCRMDYHFIPLKEFASLLHRSYPDRVPEPEQMNLSGRALEGKNYSFKRSKWQKAEQKSFQEMADISDFLVENLEEMEYFLSDFDRLCGYVHAASYKDEKIESSWLVNVFEGLIEDIESYNGCLKSIDGKSEAILSENINPQKVSAKDLVQEEIKSIENSEEDKLRLRVQRIAEEVLEVKKHSLEALEKGDEDSFKKDRKRLVKVVDRQIARLPLIEISEQDLMELIDMMPDRRLQGNKSVILNSIEQKNGKKNVAAP